MTERRAWTRAVLLTGLAALVRFLMALGVPLFPDETYYWEWSRDLAPGYFDHPPGIAWAIHAGTSLLGHSALGVRIGPMLVATCGALLILELARRIGGGRAALWAAAAVACMPLAGAGLVLATPDALLMPAAAAALYASTRAIESTPKSWVERAWWIVAGIMAGVAILSKLTALVIPLGIALALTVRGDLRGHLRRLGPWLGAGAALIVTRPFLAWNARHDWVTFGFQLAHGLDGRGGSFALRELELLGGQLGLASPILLILMATACWTALKDSDPRRSILAVVAATGGAVFVLSAARAPVEPNWPAVAYVPATVVLATAPWTLRFRRWMIRGLALGATMVAGIYAHALLPWMPIPPHRDPVARAAGWRAVAAALADETAALESGPCPAVHVEARTYQHASATTFRSPGQTRIHANNLMSRPNQYDLWDGFRSSAAEGDCLILLGRDPGTTESVVALEPSFRTVERGPRLARSRGPHLVEELRVWRLLGWSGDRTAFQRHAPPPRGDR